MSSEKNIVLVGFMGVGKTTIGQLVAEQMQRTFLDIDVLLEQQFGMSVEAIFQQFGEAKFREAERETIRHICTSTTQRVLSLGGGAFMQDAVREICLSTSDVVYLCMSFEAWRERLQFLLPNRPLLKNKSLPEIAALFHQRQPIYALSHYTVFTERKTTKDVAKEIIRVVKKQEKC